jgi:hypothetical protein
MTRVGIEPTTCGLKGIAQVTQQAASTRTTAQLRRSYERFAARHRASTQ